MSTATILVAHTGAPCHPPIVDGVEFRPHPEDPSIFIGECPNEDVLENFCRIPAFTRFEGLVPPPPPVTDRPVAQWKSADLLAKLQEGWAMESVQAKAKELGVEAPEKADRTALITLAALVLAAGKE